MISSLSFLYLRSCAGVSASLLRRSAMSWSCNRRRRLYSLATLSKVSSTLGLSSASIAASDSEPSMSSSSKSASCVPSGLSSPSPLAEPGRGGTLNGVALAGAVAGATICGGWPLPFGAGPPGTTIGRRLSLSFARHLLPHLDQFVAFGLVGLLLLAVGCIFGLDYIDTHFGEHRQHVFDLLGINLIRQRIDLIMGDVATLRGRADEL